MLRRRQTTKRLTIPLTTCGSVDGAFRVNHQGVDREGRQRAVLPVHDDAKDGTYGAD